MGYIDFCPRNLMSGIVLLCATFVLQLKFIVLVESLHEDVGETSGLGPM